jgi:hypothetical protein
MRSLHFGAGALLALTSGIAKAQFPPKPEGLKVLESRFGDGVQISYKEVSQCIKGFAHEFDDDCISTASKTAQDWELSTPAHQLRWCCSAHLRITTGNLCSRHQCLKAAACERQND